MTTPLTVFWFTTLVVAVWALVRAPTWGDRIGMLGVVLMLLGWHPSVSAWVPRVGDVLVGLGVLLIVTAWVRQRRKELSRG